MPGCWNPVLSIILEAKGWERLTDWAFFIPALGTILSPLCLAAVADQRVNAERVLALVMGANVLSTAAAFWFLGEADSQTGFLVCLILKALLGAPAWPLLMSITLTHLTEPERQFGRVRVWGTIGWMLAGWGISWAALDQSPMAGIVAAGVGAVATLFCLALPPTPPSGLRSKSLVESLGLRAVVILKDRDTGVYFLTAFLFMVPLAAYYIYTPKFLASLGVEKVATVMTVGQTSEIAAMLLIGWTFRRLPVKSIFLIALALGLARYLFCFAGAWGEGQWSRWAQLAWVTLGIFMHGFCWTLFFESGRLFVDRRVPRELRSQAQALLTIVTGGMGQITGIFVSGWIFRACLQPGGWGWTGFWLILAVLCALAGLVFAVGYQGLAAARRGK
ncbi:MFS transporter [Roseibacillus ishigakijimensis]|uniref:MFS transporter n=2 Tax=Roseibacillus ishigakijimensis TaxID=454146 RepID=A0A934VLW5_9BACT|nr:MFS transporter [Roseibacillus ishigakijimensis]